MHQYHGGCEVIHMNEIRSNVQRFLLNIDVHGVFYIKYLNWVISDQASLGKQDHEINIFQFLRICP